MKTAPTAARWALAAALLGVAATLAAREARAQLPTAEERLKILVDPDSVKKKVEKEKARPPIEMFRSQIAPFDVLPFVKPNHWSTLSLELQANYEEYAGTVQSGAVPMLGLPLEMVYRREARLPKAQRARLSMQVYMPEVPKEIGLELARPDSVRPDELWQASLRVLERPQMLVLVLAKEGLDSYTLWNRYQAMYPHSVDRTDAAAVDKQRYYRLVIPLDPEKPPLSAHPLTWTTTSHVIWDGLSPDVLNPNQQQAMIDWLHWGGQLVIVGGPGPTFSLLKDSFLAPYLPAEPTGENSLLQAADLQPLSTAYPPPYVASLRGTEDPDGNFVPEPIRGLGRRYRAPVPLRPPANRPVYLAGLKPKEGAVPLPLAESGNRLLGAEQRVGRGRVLMLGLSLNDPSLVAWPGLDTFVRRVVLRRPEESRLAQASWDGRMMQAGRFGPLPGPDLSWYRILTRDLTVSIPGPPPDKVEAALKIDAAKQREAAKSKKADDTLDDLETGPVWTPDAAVAEWSDLAAVPRMCRLLLEEASGIKIPGAGFVLKVILAYLLTIVPLNWLICRYVFGRREWAWLVVPALSLGFAVGVERAAAYDMGYNSACDEIDFVELQGGYPRGHLSRFASLYTTGRSRYEVSYPNDPTALALPLDNGRSLRGEDVSTAVWHSYPVPALVGYLVQPRSLAFFRAEQVVPLDGAVSLQTEGDVRTVTNQSNMELRDAVVVDLAGPRERREVHVGTIPPGGTVEVKEAPRAERPAEYRGALDPERVLAKLRAAYEDRPENAGEIRLVAWTPGPAGGQKIDPPVDRHRGYTAVVVHLRSGPPPSPFGPAYDSARKGDDRAQDDAPPAAPGSTVARPRNAGGINLGPSVLKKSQARGR